MLRPSKNINLQSMRGIAALLVVLFHTLAFVEPEETEVGFLWTFGEVGVDLFFIISGYLMFVIRDSYIRPFGAMIFLSRRFWRVVPPYWTYTFLVFSIFLFFPALSSGEPPSLIHSLFLIPDDRPFLIMVGWTLSHEMYFYILFAMTLSIGISSRKHLLILAFWFASSWLCGVVVQESNPIWQFVTSPLHFLFLIGATIAVFEKEIPYNLWMSGLSLSIGTLAYISFASSSSHPDRGDLFGFFQYSFVAVTLFLGLLGLTDPTGRVFNAVFGKLGDASYSLYLSHWLILNLAALVMKKIGLFTPLIFTIVSVVGACAYAVLTYRIVEQRLPELFVQGIVELQRKFKERVSR